MTPYKFTTSGEKFIPGFNAFKTEYINNLAYTYQYRSSRVYSDIMTLPYNYNDVRINTNQAIDSEAINSKIASLYKNYIYLLTKCSIGKTDGLDEFRGSTSLPASAYDHPILGLYTTAYTPTTEYNVFDAGIRSTAFLPNISTGVDSLVIATPNRLILCKFKSLEEEGTCHQLTVVSTSASESLVDSENDLEFKSISKVVSNDKGSIFTLDTGRSIIYKHNVKGLTRDDRILKAKETTGRMLDVMMGTTGDISSKIQFYNPIDISYHNDRLYVLDGGDRNYRIKVYDDQLNWSDTYNISLDFIQHNPISIAGDNGKIYVLTQQGIMLIYSISELQSGVLIPLEVVDVDLIDTDYNTVEKYIEVKFSSVNDNICYIVTNRSVYKKMVDKLSLTVGHVDWEKHNICTGSVEPICATITEQHTGVGNIVVLFAKVNTPTGSEIQLLHFTDQDYMMDMLDAQYEGNVISVEDCMIKPEEYVSSFVYNKAISKLLFNINLIYNSIIFVASSEITETGTRKYPGIRYVGEYEVAESRILDDTISSNYIGVNELVSASTLNRCLHDVVSKQEQVLNLIRDRTNRDEFYNGSVNILKNSPVPVVESFLSSGYMYRLQKIE